MKAYNARLVDTRETILCQEESGKYKEYIWYTFKTYLATINQEFNEAIKDVKRRWTQDFLSNNYSATDVMVNVSKTYNNIVADIGWTLLGENSSAGNSTKIARCPSFWRHCECRSKRSRRITYVVARQGLEQILVRSK